MSPKFSLSLGVAVLMVLVLASFAWAQTPEATVTATSPATVDCSYGNFVDENGDGVCDNRHEDGTPQEYGRGMGYGMMRGVDNFVDADEDGVCDHAADGTGAMGNHFNRSGRQGMGSGQMNPMRRLMMGRGWNQ